ncbi:MAG: N-acetyltransferase family protein [Acidimicrobiia bacterium]
MTDARIRRAHRRDASGILDIHNEVVTRSTAIFDILPRTLEEQVAWVEEHSGAHPALVAEEGSAGDAESEDTGGGNAAGDIVGYASLSPFRARPAYAPTVEDSVYVREDRQGAGIGRALLEEILVLATDGGFHSVIARIADHNAGSIALHTTCGFEVVGVEREVGRKFGRWLDVVEMQRLL